MTRLARALRLYMQETDIGQRRLAKVIGCHQSSISRLLDGKNSIDAKNAYRLFAWLLEEEKIHDYQNRESETCLTQKTKTNQFRDF